MITRMRRAGITHILFDFFGTLVDYSASRVEQGFQGSHRLLRRLGVELTYDDFLDAWSLTSAEFDQRSDRDDHEFSMVDVGAAFLAGVLGREPAVSEVETFVVQYLSEWNTGVRYLPGIEALVGELASEYRLAVVTNTQDTILVPSHLEAMGLTSQFEAVITSVEVGWRKPHPTIYSTVLEALQVSASSAVFVGDTFGPDFLGPEQAGIMAFLIDPQHRTLVPDSRRLSSIFDLPARLRASHHHHAPKLTGAEHPPAISMQRNRGGLAGAVGGGAGG
jgi:putative hydrolase of the HAD superfamily